MRLLVSTDKGLLVYKLESEKWKMDKIHFLGMPVGTTMVDQRSGQWWAALNHKHWGAKLHLSEDDGKHWMEVQTPWIPSKYDQSVKSIWTVDYGSNDDKNRFYVGVEPAALFVTKDGGNNFELLSGLSDHPSRYSWMGGGKGSKDPFLHTLIVDPDDYNHLYAAISCAGVFQSWDRGKTWESANAGMEAFYLTDTQASLGHDPHALRIPRTNHNIIWQQNHRGIFLSKDKGKSWTNISDKTGYPSYGFAMVVDEENDNRAWVVPAQNDDLRIPTNNALTVFKTEDYGQSWIPQNNGLPHEGSFDLVLRRGMDICGSHIVFGTNNGNLYYSSDYGEYWQIINQNLTTVRDIQLIDKS